MGASAQERKRVQAVELMCNVQSRAVDRQVADVDELRSLALLETALGQSLMIVRKLRRMDTVENADHDSIRTDAGMAAGVLEGVSVQDLEEEPMTMEWDGPTEKKATENARAYIVGMKRAVWRDAIDAAGFGLFLLGTLAVFCALWAVYP